MTLQQQMLNNLSLQILGLPSFPSDVEKGSLEVLSAYARTGKCSDPMVIAAKNTALLHLRYLAGINRTRCQIPIYESSCKICKGSGIYNYHFEHKQVTCTACNGTKLKRGLRCPACNGVGNKLQMTCNIESYNPCKSCKGTGFDERHDHEVFNNGLAEGLKDLVR